jgi:hypothetical protein
MCNLTFAAEGCSFSKGIGVTGSIAPSAAARLKSVAPLVKFHS